MNESEYQEIIVESFKPADTSGRHGPIHIRPIPRQDLYNDAFRWNALQIRIISTHDMILRILDPCKQYFVKDEE